MDVTKLQKKALELRKLTIDQVGYLGVGHIGGAMSIIELLTVLYYHTMQVDSENPKWEGRDRLVLSKGHAGPALYATLADKGFFPKDWLHTLNAGGTNLPSHCDMNKTPGIDFTTGSLGQGSSAAVGIAKALKMKGSQSWTYLILGDGECQEGQVWEASMSAPQFELDNLIAFVDNNKQQIDGFTNDIMSIEEADARWKAFGWHTLRIDGHDMQAISQAIEEAKATTGKPSMIILDTQKSRGFIPGEHNLGNHNMSFDYETAKKAIEDLEAREATK